MKNKSGWKPLLDRIQVRGRLTPITDNELNEFEAATNMKLPRSYREFCKVLGPGTLKGRIRVGIAVPGYGLETMNEMIWSADLLDLDEMCPEPDLVRRGLFFGSDIYTNNYFWDRAKITDTKDNELAIYTIYRDWAIHPLADTFESFIYDICLDKGIPDCGKLDGDQPIFYVEE